MKQLMYNSRWNGMKSSLFNLVAVVALAVVAGVAFPSFAGLVAKWDFNNYDPANPTSANVLRATVGGDGKPCHYVGKGSACVADGTLGKMYVVAPGVAGVCKEVTCPPAWSTCRDAAHTVDSLTLYDAWRKSGCMKGAFFGHDHTNTFDGMDRNGIRLGMTKSFNCGGSYGDREPGFRVFRVRRDGSFESWTETENTQRNMEK